MDSLVAFGSHSHLVQPITSFLKACQAIHQKHHETSDPNIQTLLALIPSIDPVKLDAILADVKASNFRISLQSNGYDVNSIDLSIFTKYSFLDKYSEIQCLLIFLYCILTFIYPSGFDQDFKSVLSLLHKAQRSSLTVVHDFCFELVLSAILSAKNQQEIYEIVLNYLLNITSIAPTAFPLLITLFKLVSKTGNETELILLQHTIGHMLECDFSCIHDVDPALLVEPLFDSILAFNRSSLNVLGTATKAKVSRNLMEFIHKLYKRFLSFIAENAKSEPLRQTQQQNSEEINNQNIESSENSENLEKAQTNDDDVFHIDFTSRVPKHNYIYMKRKPFKFSQILLNEVSVPKDFPRIISEEIYQLALSMANFLSKSNNEVILDFIAQYSVYLSHHEHFFEYCSVFLTIAYQLTEPDTVSTILRILGQTLLFDPHQTIFQPKSFDQRINYLRNLTFDFITITDPSQVVVLLEMSQKDPFILNENLLRIMLKFEKFSPTIFVQESVLFILAYSILDLQTSTRKKLEPVRSSNFAFISALLNQPDAVNVLLSSPLFVASYLQMIYEPGLEDFILSTFSKALTVIDGISWKRASEIVKFFQQLIISCTKKAREGKENYKKLFTKSIDSIILGLQYNQCLVQSFSCLFNNILEYLKVSPSIEGTLSSMRFLQLINMNICNWELSPRQFNLLVSIIKSICGDEPDERIVDLLYVTMMNVSFLSSHSCGIILSPSILTLLFAIHSKSKKNLNLLNTFIELCRYSKENCVAMHDAFIDYLLIEYLSKNEDHCFINFRAMEFVFNLQEALPLILELLENIICVKTSFSIANSLLNLLVSTQDNSIYNFVSKLLLNGKSEKATLTTIPLDSPKPFIQINGVDWSKINSQFTLDFNLCMDEIIMRRYRQDYILMEIFDKSNNKFTLSLKNTALSACYETQTEKSTTFLFRNIFQSEWGHFTIIASPSKDKLKFYNFLNKERMSDSTMDFFTFNGPVTIRFGGSDFHSEHMKHPCYGKMYGFQFFSTRASDEDVILLADSPKSFPIKPIFTTNDIESEANKIIKVSDQITINLLPPFHRVMHILDFFSEPSLFERILNIERIEIALDIISYVFSKHPEIQPFFNLVDRLSLMAAKDLKYSTYLSLYSILDIIQYPELQTKWFEKLILNISVWAKSENFYNIVLHWTKNFVPNIKFFQKKNYFANMLSQFMKTYANPSKQKQLKTIQQFYKFMTMISRFHFNKESFDVLLSCILLCNNQSNLWDLMHILHAVSKTDVALSCMTKEKLTKMYELYKKFKNTKLLALITYCIHNLSSKIPFYNLVSVSYLVFDYKMLNSFVDILISNLNSYPRLLSLVTILAIHSEKCQPLVNAIKYNIESDKPTLLKVVNENYWFIWPIILMLNVSEDLCDILCKYIATCLTLTDGNADIEQVFTMMFRMSFFIPKYDMIVRVLHHIHSFYTNNNVEIPDSVVEYCFVFFFLHIPQTLHSIPLLNLFSNSSYHDHLLQRKSSMYFIKFNIFELEGILVRDFLEFDLQCRVSLDEDGNVADKFYYDIYQNLEAPKKPLFDKKLMQYFIDRNSLDQQTQFSMAQNLTKVLDNLKKSVIDDICTSLVKIKNDLLSLLTNAKEQTNQAKKENKKQLEKLYQIDSNDTKTVSQTISKISQNKTNTLYRANLNCASYCPFRIRKKQTKGKRLYPKLTGTPNHGSYKCLIIKQDKRKQCTFSVYNDKLVFLFNNSLTSNKLPSNTNSSPNPRPNANTPNPAANNNSSVQKPLKGNKQNNEPTGPSKKKLMNRNNQMEKYKVIPLDLIMFIFPRKFGNDNGYEFFLYNAKSYLVIFQKNEFITLTAVLKTMHFSSAEAVVFQDEPIDLSLLTQEWVNGNLSNFDYLIKLNLFAGRSFHNLSIYPALPPVIHDFNKIDSNVVPNGLTNIIIPVSPLNDQKFRESFVENLVVAPEYYFDSSVIKPASLPTWAKTKYEFVYVARKKLESLDVSWFINRLFGPNKSRDNQNLTLFTKPHPTRNPHFQQFPNFVFETGRNVSYVLTYLTSGKLAFLIIFENKNVCVTEPIEDSQKLNLKYTTKIDCDDPTLTIFSSHHKIIAYSRRQASLHYFVSPTKIVNIPLYTEHPLFALLDDTLIFCRDECLICKMVFNTKSIELLANQAQNQSPAQNHQNVQNTKSHHAGQNYIQNMHQNISKICYAESKVTAIAASSVFKTVAFATLDGFLHVHDLLTNEELSKVNFGHHITNIVITANWGFVVGSSGDRIFVLNANGENILTQEYKFIIEKLFPFSNRAGFDFVAFETSDRQVGFIEVLCPGNPTTIRKCDSPTVKVTYDNLHRTFIVSQENGHIAFVPYDVSVSL
ncbi:hypothetical protein TRFO_13357 [Tritrichomonas foetus]|uniref:BEACH domain-containing protein n=1 Tax=Tritrichomonas foetus TaxID=1144522 RepID=A0A1J4KZB1_9EUKA|nr:hypothetical protein TRFO_13357 [Tritrichomonas foetus]|eukprot:OHT16200.1 hypothetical protein TRFO_13357 [Tritrichomonas foetus]